MLTISIQKIIWFASVWSILLPFFAGILFFRRLDRDSKMIFYIVAAAVPPQLLTLKFPHSTTLDVLYNIYTIVEFALVYFFIGRKLEKPGFKQLSLVPVVFFGIFVLYSVIREGLLGNFNTWVCIADSSYLCWIFLFILESLEKEVKLLDADLPIFWYISAFILYAPCTIFVFALYSYIDTSTNPFIHGLWSIQSVFNTTLYVLFTIGLIKSRKRLIV